MSDLVGNPEDRFSQNEAHLYLPAETVQEVKCLIMLVNKKHVVDQIRPWSVLKTPLLVLSIFSSVSPAEIFFMRIYSFWCMQSLFFVSALLWCSVLGTSYVANYPTLIAYNYTHRGL